MDTNVMVSVLCVTYNHQNYIRRCLESLVCQKTDFRYEIIVHDDASTDGTQDIIREYAEKYPNLIIPIIEKENQYSKEDNNLYASFISVASGKYAAVIEGDDYWCDPDKLRLQVEALEAHPECAICVHATDTVDTKGEPQSMHFPEIKIEQSVVSTKEYIRHVLADGYWMFHLSCFMVSGELLREYAGFMANGFPSRFYYVGDLPVFLYFALKGDLYYIDRVMSVYTLQSGGFMSRVSASPEFAARVLQGFVDGLTSFDEYSGYRFHSEVEASLVKRRFEIERIQRRFDRIVRHPEYRPLIRERGLIKTIAFYIVGYAMLLTRKIRKGDKND